jgi:hypothetical protein
MPIEEPDFLKHALKSQYNIIGLVTVLGFAVLSGSLLPLILAAGAEMIALPLISSNPRYQRWLRARKAEEQKQQDTERKQYEAAEMLRALPDDEQSRYSALERLIRDIRENYRGLDSTSRILLDETVRKLDFLLAFYLRMRFSLMRYEAYFSTTDPKRIEARIAALDRETAQEPLRLQQIKARTRGVLVKRLDRYQKALESRQLIEAQTETVLEVLRLLRDQSFAIRDPRTITGQLDDLVSAAEETERGVKDMEELLSAEQDYLLASPGTLTEDVLEDVAPEVAPPARTPRAIEPSTALPPPPPPPPRKKIVH